ncbi:MAG: hypothetical protein HDQ88_10855 [Clostridia bacterium]|nr:hypothetical protein [Clostridia bacterium]
MQLTITKANLIIDKIKNYANTPAFSKLEKDNPTVAEQIKNLKAEDLRLGECPVFGVAQIEGDLTANGVRYTDARGRVVNSISSRLDDGYIPRYTLACGFVTDPILFASPENRADPTTLQIVAQRLDFKTYHYEKEAQYMGDDTARKVAKEELSRLNYKLEDCRVNSRRISYTYGPLPVYIYPVIVDLKDKKGNLPPTVLGTYSEQNLDNGEALETPEIIINIVDVIKKQKISSKTSKSAKTKKIVGLVFGILGVLAIAGVITCLALGVYKNT